MHNCLNDIVYLHYCAMTGVVITPSGNLKFVEELLQIAMDLRINDILVASGLGTMPADGWHNPDLGSRSETVSVIYERLYRKTSGGKKMEAIYGQPGQACTGGKTGEGFDIIMKPGASGVDGDTPEQAAQDRQNDQDKWEREIQVAAAISRAQGRLPGALAHVFGEITTHLVPWPEHLRADLARTFGGGSYNWKKPDRKFIVRNIYVPGRSSYACDVVAVAWDTSGSIQQEEIDNSWRETAGILEDLRPERLILFSIDAAIHSVDIVTSMDDMEIIRTRGVKGRGGTDFRPVFEWLENEGIAPDALVYFTDGWGTFPNQEPDYPVIWGAFPETKATWPGWGKVVEIPRSK
jgi:predicted metal-dependent peptidase